MFINLSPKNDWYTWDDIIHQSYFKMWNIDTHQSNRLITRENNYKFTTNGFQMYFAILSSYKSYFNYKIIIVHLLSDLKSNIVKNCPMKNSYYMYDTNMKHIVLVRSLYSPCLFHMLRKFFWKKTTFSLMQRNSICSRSISSQIPYSVYSLSVYRIVCTVWAYIVVDACF